MDWLVYISIMFAFGFVFYNTKIAKSFGLNLWNKSIFLRKVFNMNVSEKECVKFDLLSLKNKINHIENIVKDIDDEKSKQILKEMKGKLNELSSKYIELNSR